MTNLVKREICHPPHICVPTLEQMQQVPGEEKDSYLSPQLWVVALVLRYKDF